MEVNSLEYREIPEDKILEFPATPGFKGWRSFFTGESITHPAKMNLNLLRWIIETYTEPGELILDPMAGTGSTIILSSLLGRHGIAVEYESRFCDMIRANIELTERQTTLIPKGRMTCIQGDARELSKIIEESEIIVTSPPYSGSVSTTGDSDRRANRMRKAGLDPKTIVGGRARSGEIDGRNYESKENIGNLPHGDIDAIISSPPYSNSNVGGDDDEKRIERLKEAIERGDTVSNRNLLWLKSRMKGMKQGTQLDRERGYSGGPGNIVNLPHGDIDAIVTSPPYSLTREGSDRTATGIDVKTGKSLWSKTGSDFSKGNIQKLPHGDIDAIVTSPPFGPSTTGGGIFKEGYTKPGDEEVSDPGLPQRHARPLSDDPRNIDNLEYGESVDSIVTSPPYEGSRAFHDIEFMKSIAKDQSEKARRGETKSHYKTEEAELRYLDKIESGKIEDPDNIGSMKGETYLEAMIKVYHECWKVLKQSGKLILVTKNFIRDKQVVRLDLDTIRLCEAVGFRLADHWYFKQPTKSFWRILYKKRFPHAPDIEYEDVMIFSKEERNIT